MKFSYHTHCEFCDGKADASSMAAAAHAAGYSILGFSSHAPLPFTTKWNMPGARLEEYARIIRALAAAWKPEGLEILLGLEADWIEDVCAPGNGLFASISPDFLIGSVHYIKLGGNEIFTVDESESAFDAHLAAASGGDAEPAWREYYHNLRALIESGGFDILGHFDLVRKNNRNGRLFDEESTAYRDEAFASIELAAKKNVVVEINTGGVARRKVDTPYPSLTLLNYMRESGVRITLGDDAHAPGHIGAFNGLAREHAGAAGYRSLWYLDGTHEWKEVGIEDV
ncbi:MAG: histidinol-phosphatase [Rectinemataceae bacterium]